MMQKDLFGEQKTHKEVIRTEAQKIKGLQVFFDFVTAEQEYELLKHIDKVPWLKDLNRRVQHYGYKYDYRARKIDNSFYLGPLPQWLKKLADSLFEQSITNFTPDQAIINEYEPGQGIAPHIDCEPCFGDTIITMSLGSDCIMEFKQASNLKEKIELLLPKRSLVVMRDKARYNWYHGIPKRNKDRFNNDTISRKRRVSITFRKVILE